MRADVIILGAGAAGLFCAFQTAQRGRKVLVLEKQARPGLKILISGGGRCNFTNLKIDPSDFTSQNPHFCKSALARYTSADFIALVEKHEIAYHEKYRGQLFCNHSSKEILNMLLSECEKASVQILYNVTVRSVEKNEDSFQTTCSIIPPLCKGRLAKSTSPSPPPYKGGGTRVFYSKNLVVATGGLSYKNLGATDLGYRIAESFGHKIISPQPALTPLLWSKKDRDHWRTLAGVACPVQVKMGDVCESDDLLFTHTGLSGPVILRATLHWKKGDPLFINFFPQQDLPSLLKEKKDLGNKTLMKNFLSKWIPARLADFLCNETGKPESLQHFEVNPVSVDGFDKAEVTSGGVSTDSVSSKTMESKHCPGLYFIGEVMDVTGDLGGYNFQWAWASAFAVAESLGV